MFRIGEFSKMSKTTIKTLRYYDEMGLLKPEETDVFTGYRFYTGKQLIQLHRIQSYRQIGLSINDIKLILNGKDFRDILLIRKSELLSELENGYEQLSRIEFILSDQEEKKFMNYQVTMKELPECIVYSKTMTVPSYNDYFNLIPALGEQLKAKYPDVKCTIPEYCFIKYLDGEYKEKNIHIEFCEAITKIYENFDEIIFKKIPKVNAISVMHKGAYRNLSQAYAYAFKWIEENGYVAADSPRESYIDGIWNKQTDQEWLTEIQIPVKKL